MNLEMKNTSLENVRTSMILWRGAMVEIYRVNPEMAKAGVVAAVTRVRQAADPSSEQAVALEAVRKFIEDAKRYMP